MKKFLFLVGALVCFSGAFAVESNIFFRRHKLKDLELPFGLDPEISVEGVKLVQETDQTYWLKMFVDMSKNKKHSDYLKNKKICEKDWKSWQEGLGTCVCILAFFDYFRGEPSGWRSPFYDFFPTIAAGTVFGIACLYKSSLENDCDMYERELRAAKNKYPVRDGEKYIADGVLVKASEATICKKYLWSTVLHGAYVCSDAVHNHRKIDKEPSLAVDCTEIPRNELARIMKSIYDANLRCPLAQQQPGDLQPGFPNPENLEGQVEGQPRETYQ